MYFHHEVEMRMNCFYRHHPNWKFVKPFSFSQRKHMLTWKVQEAARRSEWDLSALNPRLIWWYSMCSIWHSDTENFCQAAIRFRARAVLLASPLSDCLPNNIFNSPTTFLLAASSLPGWKIEETLDSILCTPWLPALKIWGRAKIITFSYTFTELYNTRSAHRWSWLARGRTR